MFRKIMVPVDLAHLDALGRALEIAADLSKLYAAPVCYVGVTAPVPTEQAHNPAEYRQKLDAFVEEQTHRHGHQATARAYASPDPATDLDETLLAALRDTEADLVVMATHIPTLIDYVWPSHGGRVATHADASVFLVR